MLHRQSPNLHSYHEIPSPHKCTEVVRCLNHCLTQTRRSGIGDQHHYIVMFCPPFSPAVFMTLSMKAWPRPWSSNLSRSTISGWKLAHSQ